MIEVQRKVWQIIKSPNKIKESATISHHYHANAKQSDTNFDDYKVKQIITEHFKRMNILRKSIRMMSFASNIAFLRLFHNSFH
jgi:hypothetical protein